MKQLSMDIEEKKPCRRHRWAGDPSCCVRCGIYKSAKRAKDPMRVATGKKSKRKGSNFERFIVNELKAAGIDAKRGWWQSGEFARCRGGTKPRVPDVMVDGFWLELGDGATMDDYTKLDQAKRDSVDITDVTAVAITRRKGQRVVFATIDFDDLVEISRDKLAHLGAGVLPSPFRVSLRFPEFVKLIAPANIVPAPFETSPVFTGGDFEE